MNAWLDAIAQLTGIKPTEIEPSLSHLRMLLPEGRFRIVAVAVVAFCLVAAWQDARFDHRRQRKVYTRQR